MRLIDNARIGIKLTLLSGTAILIILLLGLGGTYGAMTMNQQARLLIARHMQPAQAVSDLRAAAGIMRAQYQEVSSPEGLAQAERIRMEVGIQENAIALRIENLRKAGLDGAEAQALNEVTTIWTTYLQGRSAFWKEVERAEGGAVSSTRRTEMQELLKKMEGALSQLNRLTEQASNAVGASLSQQERLMLQVGFGGVLAALVLIVTLFLLIRRSLVRPLRNLSAVALQISQGHLSQEIEETARRDEIGHLHNSVVQMATSIRGLLVEINESALVVGESATAMLEMAESTSATTLQLAEAVTQVATGATDQNQSVQRTSQVAQQMQAAIQQVAQGAHQQATHVAETAQLSEAAGRAAHAMADRVESLRAAAGASSDSAEAGVVVVAEAMTVMERLKNQVEEAARNVDLLTQQTRQIGQVGALITEIADQTNLLALNAAIEAARAGESGRGFAVVADEVRRLAERSRASAGEITELVKSIESRTGMVSEIMVNSRAEAQVSNRRAGEGAQALQAIARTVRETVQDIGSLQQSTAAVVEATRQAGIAVDQIYAITKESSAATEQMAASSSEVGRSFELVSAVATQTSATAQEVSASVEEWSHSSEQVAITARHLTELSRQLHARIERFRM